MVDWDAFRVILAIHREGSIIGAARTLGVNQATIGRQLNRAEKELEAKLFYRMNNGLIATSAGEIAINHAASIEEKVANARIKLLGSNEKEQGVIRLSVPHNAMPYGLSNDIKLFREMHPLIDFQINATDSAVNFLDMEVDVVVRADNNPSSGLWGYRLADIQYSFYGSQAFLEKWSDEMEASPETVPLPIVALSNARPNSDREQIMTMFPNAQVVFECNGMDSLIPLVFDGAGLGRIGRFMASYIPGLAPVMDCDTDHKRSLWVLTHQDYRETWRIRVFMEFLRDRFHSRLHEFE